MAFMLSHVGTIINWYRENTFDTFSMIGYTSIFYVLTAFFVVRFGFGRSIYLSQTFSNSERKSSFILWTLFPSQFYTGRTIRRDFALFCFNYLVLTSLFSTFLTPVEFNELAEVIAAAVLNFIFYSFGHIKIPFSNGYGTDLVYTLSLYLAFEAGKYFIHVLLHQIPMLWEFHKIHHSAKSLNIITNFRAHFFEILLSNIVTGSLTAAVMVGFKYLFAVSPSQLTIAGSSACYLITLTWTSLQHSHLWWSMGKIEYFANSPAMHLLHHSTNPKHFNSNYGSSLSLWDSVFGTLRRSTDSPPQNLEFGVDDGIDWESVSIWKFYYLPIVMCYRLVEKPLIAKDVKKSHQDRDVA